MTCVSSLGSTNFDLDRNRDTEFAICSELKEAVAKSDLLFSGTLGRDPVLKAIVHWSCGVADILKIREEIRLLPMVSTCFKIVQARNVEHQLSTSMRAWLEPVTKLCPLNFFTERAAFHQRFRQNKSRYLDTSTAFNLFRNHKDIIRLENSLNIPSSKSFLRKWWSDAAAVGEWTFVSDLAHEIVLWDTAANIESLVAEIASSGPATCLQELARLGQPFLLTTFVTLQLISMSFSSSLLL